MSGRRADAAEVVTEAPTGALAHREESGVERLEAIHALDLEQRYRMLAAQLLHDEVAWEAYMQRCEMIAKTQMYGHKDSSTVAIAGLKGFAMGWDLPAALERIRVIHGRPCIRGEAAVGYIRSKGFHFECVESTADVARWECSRRGMREKTFVYTREKAELAGLPEKNPVWKKFPEELLKWACATMVAKEYFPDILGGFEIAQSSEAIDVAVVEAGGAVAGADPGAAQSKPVEVDHRRQSTILLAKVIQKRLAARDVDAVAGEEPYNKEKAEVWSTVTHDMKLSATGPTTEDWIVIGDRLRELMR